MEVNGKHFKQCLSRQDLLAIVQRLGAQITADYRHRKPLLCPVLTGSYIFAADLTRQLGFDAHVQFVKYTSYSGLASTGVVKADIPFTDSCRGRDVIIIEDIVETGISMAYMLQQLHQFNPASVAVCTMFFKPDRFQQDFKIDYIGQSIGNDFILGYGLDYDGYGRLLPELYVLDE